MQFVGTGLHVANRGTDASVRVPDNALTWVRQTMGRDVDGTPARAPVLTWVR